MKSIDPATSVITISSGFNGSAKLITIHLAKNTVLRRYAPASVNYESARPAPVDAIHPGDQLRARGAKSADGLSLDAEEIVSGSFRNISGVISAIDPAAGTISLKDLASKKQVTLQIPQEAQLHRLPEFLSRMISAKLKGANGAAASPHTTEAEASHSTHSGSNGAADPQQALSHLPQLKITDLKKGDAIMAVTTDGTEKVTTITLLAGVEALLEAPAAQDLLSSWSMGGGEASGQ